MNLLIHHEDYFNPDTLFDQVQQKQTLYENEKKHRESLQTELEMKDHFLSLVTHELKTPLSVINLAIQTMEIICSNDLTPQIGKLLNRIQQNTFKQMRLVNNLLDISRASEGRIKVNGSDIDIVSLTKLTLDIVSDYAGPKGIIIDFICEMPAIVINTDEDKYIRILLNLLSNAVKFSPSDRPIQVTLGRIKESVFIEVQDQGVGIPGDKLKRIFDKPDQAYIPHSKHLTGIGIGLPLTKLLVEALEGSISVISAEGKGSSFKVILPFTHTGNMNPCEAIYQLSSLDNRLRQAVSIEFSDMAVE